MNQCFGDIQARVLAEVVNEYEKRISELECKLEESQDQVIAKTNNLRDLQENLDLPECENCGVIGSDADYMWFCTSCECILCDECIAYSCPECDTLLCPLCYSDAANNESN